MIKTVGIAIVVLVALLLAYASTRPDSFRVTRTVSIGAPAEKVFPLVDDFHRWSVWSPWEKLDPAMKRTYGGAVSGKGAVYEWDGDGKVGAGRMEITVATPASSIAIQLDFLRPMVGHNVAEFSFTPKGSATDVTWSMHGPSPFVSKVMGIFFSMDSLIGKDFEAGLANLKAAAEL